MAKVATSRPCVAVVSASIAELVAFLHSARGRPGAFLLVCSKLVCSKLVCSCLMMLDSWFPRVF
jgi:hypothetical protein